MNEKCNAWLTKTIQFLPDENQRKDLIKKLNAFGGEEGVAPKVDGTYLRKMLDDISSHGRMDRDSYEILSSDIPQITGMKKAAQDYLADTARNAEKFANWQQKEQQAGVEAYKANHNGETQKVLAELPEVKIHLDALSPEEFAALNKEYSEVVRDYVSGPRSAARRGMEHVRLQLRTRKKQRA